MSPIDPYSAFMSFSCATASSSPPGRDLLTAQPLSLPSVQDIWPEVWWHDHKLIINLQPRLSWIHVHWWTPLCLNKVFAKEKLWLAQKSNNKPPLGLWSGRSLLPNASRCHCHVSTQVSRHLSTWTPGSSPGRLCSKGGPRWHQSGQHSCPWLLNLGEIMFKSWCSIIS